MRTTTGFYRENIIFIRHLYFITTYMKAVLVSFITFLAVVTASAQKFEFGLNVGSVYTDVVKGVTPSGEKVVRGWMRSSTGPVVSLKAMRVTDHWKYGLFVDYSKYAYEVVWGGQIICYGVPSGMTNAEWEELEEARRKSQEATYGRKTISCLPVKAFANRVFVRKKHMEVYGGLSIGYIFITKTETPQTEAFSFKNNGNIGYLGGLQLGATYFISKHIGVNAEVNADYMNITSGPSNFTVITVPVTIGARIKI